MNPFVSAFWKPLSLSTEWLDVTPVSMNEGDDPVVSIEYEDAAGEVLSYLYAMTSREESSDRALELSRRAVLCNLSGYTAWAFRRMILEGMAADSQDRDFSEGVLESMPKNYQLWNHRRRLAECVVDAGSEDLDYDFDFAKRALDGDAKNYHAWAHRQALLDGEDVAMLEKERKYAEALIDLDVHNNSAWTQKAFVLETSSAADVKDVDDVFEALFTERELPYVTEKIKLAPHNGASWSYLYGLMTNENLSRAFWKKSNDVFGLVFGVLQDWPSCPAALDFLGQMYGKLASMHAGRENWGKARKAGNNAVETWENLQVVDPIRAGYYRHMIHLMSAKLRSWPE